MNILNDENLKKFLDELSAMPEAAVDYVNAPKTTTLDWQDAEVFLPVTRDEFKEIEAFLAARRAQAPDNSHPQTTR